MLSQISPSLLELIINKALALNSYPIDLKKLEQKTLTIVLTELGFPLSFSVNNNTVIVSNLTERADCTINTSISTLRELKAEQQLTELIKQDKLDLTGDMKVAQQFATITEHLNIDWQSELAKHIGDVPTHKLVKFGNKLANKLQFAAKQIKADTSEYIVHEKRLVVTRSQVEQFNLHVVNISAEVNSLDTRIKALTQGTAKVSTQGLTKGLIKP